MGVKYNCVCDFKPQQVCFKNTFDDKSGGIKFRPWMAFKLIDGALKYNMNPGCSLRICTVHDEIGSTTEPLTEEEIKHIICYFNRGGVFEKEHTFSIDLRIYGPKLTEMIHDTDNMIKIRYGKSRMFLFLDYIVQVKPVCIIPSFEIHDKECDNIIPNKKKWIDCNPKALIVFAIQCKTISNIRFDDFIEPLKKSYDIDFHKHKLICNGNVKDKECLKKHEEMQQLLYGIQTNINKQKNIKTSLNDDELVKLFNPKKKKKKKQVKKEVEPEPEEHKEPEEPEEIELYEPTEKQGEVQDTKKTKEYERELLNELEEQFEEFIEVPNKVVKYKPNLKHKIVFLIDYSYAIENMLIDVYLTNQKIMNLFDSVRYINVMKDIHKDLNGRIESTHFNIVIEDVEYHCYCKFNKIRSITKIVDMM